MLVGGNTGGAIVKNMGWFDKLVAATDDGMENEFEKPGWLGFIADDAVDGGVIVEVDDADDDVDDVHDDGNDEVADDDGSLLWSPANCPKSQTEPACDTPTRKYADGLCWNPLGPKRTRPRPNRA